MTVDWKPEPFLFDGICQRSGINGLDISDEFVFEFANYWSGEFQQNTEAQWIGKLITKFKRDSAASPSSKPKGNGTRDSSLVDDLTDRSWAS